MMTSIDVQEELKKSKVGWESLTEEQKIENLLSRLRLWMKGVGMTANQLEFAMDVAINVAGMARAHGVKVGADETA